MSEQPQPLPEEPLSERELDVLEQLMSGASNKEIAATLFISPNTVKVHLRNIYSKLNVSTRTEASMTALELGLFAPPGEGEPEPETEPELETELASESIVLSTASEPEPEPMVLPTAVDTPPAPPPEPAEPQPEPARDWRVWGGAGLILLLILLAGGWWLTQAFPVMAPQDVDSTAVAPAALTNQPPPDTRFVETELSESRWYRSRPLPLALSDLALVSNGLNLYQIGGRTAVGATTNLVHVYDTSRREWQRVTDKPTAVSDTTAAVLLEIYVPGGRDASGDPVRTVEAYSPLNDQWRVVADLPQPLAGGLALADNKAIYLFGGWNGSEFVADSYLYDPISDSWRTLPPMPTPRAGAMGGLIGGLFYVVGGENETGPLTHCEVFDPTAESWASCPDLTQARSGGGAAVVFNNLYIMGGMVGDDTQESFSELFNTTDNVWRIINHPLRDEESIGWDRPAVANVEARIYILGGNSAQNFVYIPPIYQTFIPAVGGSGEGE